MTQYLQQIDIAAVKKDAGLRTPAMHGIAVRVAFDRFDSLSENYGEPMT